MHDSTMVLSGEVGAGAGARSAKVGTGLASRARAIFIRWRAFRAADRFPLSLKARNDTRQAKGEPALAADAAPAFRWWTFAALIAYTVSLLVFCGYVTLRYPAADALQGRLAASSPPHLPMLSFKPAHVAQDGRPLRMVCYQVAD